MFHRLIESSLVKNPNNGVYLISFPRTGSHWLRCLIELITERNCFPTAFFYHNIPSWGIHMHDINVDLASELCKESMRLYDLKKVLYIYRNTIDTVYSNLRFGAKSNIMKGDKGTDPLFRFNEKNVTRLVKNYVLHKKRWIENNSDIKNVLIISYEDLLLNCEETLIKVIKFLDLQVKNPVIKAVSYLNKDMMRESLKDSRVIPNSKIFETDKDYYLDRLEFERQYLDLIHEHDWNPIEIVERKVGYFKNLWKAIKGKI